MNGWDAFTWLSAATLMGSAVVIFGFFLRDVKSILKHERRNSPEEAGEDEESPDFIPRGPG